MEFRTLTMKLKGLGGRRVASLATFIAVLTAILSACKSGDKQAANSSSEAVVIGAIFSQTGFGAQAGQGELNATILAAEDINQSGGLNGKPLKIVYEDNRSEAKGTASAFRKVTPQLNVPILLGPNWAEFSEVAAPLAEGESVVMLTASGYSKTLTANRNFIFSTSPRHEHIIRPLGEYLLKKRFPRVVLYQNASAYFESLGSSLTEQLAAAGIHFQVTENFDPGTTDYRSKISALKDQNIDAVVALLFNNGEISSFLRQANELQYDGEVLTTGDLLLDPVVEKDLNLANGVVFFDWLPLASKDFQDRYRKRFNTEPILNAGRAYDNVFLIKGAIESCGRDAPAIRECLRKTDFTGTSGHLRFDSAQLLAIEGDISKLFTIVNGRVKALADEERS